jgi:mannose-6-phosphate isomerase-like protein (cupin superfamily)
MNSSAFIKTAIIITIIITSFTQCNKTSKTESKITPKSPFIINMKAFRDAPVEIQKENRRSPGISLNFLQTEKQTVVTKTEQRINKDRDETLYILNGSVKVTFTDIGEDTVTEGGLILIPAGVSYSLDRVGNKPAKILVLRTLPAE